MSVKNSFISNCVEKFNLYQFRCGFLFSFFMTSLFFFLFEFTNDNPSNCNSFAPIYVDLVAIAFGFILVHRGYKHNDFFITFFGAMVLCILLLQMFFIHG
jgi:hypothetical protein